MTELHVSNLSSQVTEEDLKELFAEYGTVTRVHLPQDRETGHSRGFGFVEMSNEDEENKAIETLNEAEWMGRKIVVKKGRSRESGGSDLRHQSRYRSK